MQYSLGCFRLKVYAIKSGDVNKKMGGIFIKVFCALFLNIEKY